MVSIMTQKQTDDQYSDKEAQARFDPRCAVG
jgi:hypothetical protein